MVTATVNLGGPASSIRVGRIAHGLMMMTWTPVPASDEQCFEAIKSGVDALPLGTKMVLNSGEFYSQTWGTENLEMLSRFYAMYPDYAERTFLSVKGGLEKGHMPPRPDASLANLRSSIENIQRALGSIKKVDLFEPARIDPTMPIETQMENLVTLVKEGKFDYIGLSECSAETLRRANAVHPVTAAEIEVSPWSYDDNQKSVIRVAKELNISVIAYSPLGKGFLTGKIKSRDDLVGDGDIRSHMTRFSEDTIKHNFALVDTLVKLSERAGCTAAQLSLAWVASLGSNVIPLPGSSKSTRTLENLEAGDLKLSNDQLAEINMAIETHEVKGDRYYGLSDQEAHLWG